MKLAQLKDAGSLSHRLVLQRPTEIADDCGSLDVTWVDIAPLWADIIPAKTSSSFLAQQDLEETSHVIIIRFRHDVASGWRFKKDGRYFLIHWLYDVNERQQYLACYCKEEAR